MNPITKLIVEHRWMTWILPLLAAVFSGYLANELVRSYQVKQHHEHLATETERRASALMTMTVNGNLMGAIGLLGITDTELKREAKGEIGPNTARVAELLESVCRSFDAAGIFLVDAKGVAGSAWYASGNPPTGKSLKFRSYYQMAMQGMNNVYAAIGTGNNERILYYAVPIYSGTTNGTDPIGALVARFEMYQTDSLLKDQADITMLLSPQNVVFASNKEEWIGRLAGKATPERIRAIREIKQFGNMFDNKEPLPLPIPTEEARFEIDGGSYAAAKAKVAWNDPLGDWTLVAIDDLSRVIPLREPLLVSLSTGLLVLLLVALLIRLAHSNYARTLASHQLEAHARDQAINAERKDRIAGAAVRMQRAKSMLELSQVFLDECHVMFGALQGALYVAEEQNRLLRRVGSYACAMPPQETILYGEGLLGQCAVERRLLIEFSGTGIFFTLRSGLGETQPAALLIAPALLNEMLLGVTEIALLHQPQETDLELFKELTGLLAMNIEIISRHTQTAVLLSATRAEDATLTEQLHFQQALVDTIPYPVFYKGPDTRFLGFNRAYEETFKVRREDLIGKRVLDLDYLPEADRLAYQAEDEATIASVGTVRRALKIPFADGKLHNTMYFVSGFRQPDGSPGGLVGTFIDMGINDAEQLS